MKKILLTTIFLLFTVPVFAKNTILIVGDSISAGYGLNPDQGWVILLQKRLTAEKYPYEVINASTSGDTTSNGLARIPQALQTYQPKITIIELGANDGLRGINIDVFKENLQKIILLVKNAKSEVVLLGMRIPQNYGAIYTERFQQVYQQLAKENNIALVPIFLINVDTNLQLLQADQLHPKADAQKILLENVWPTLKKILKK